MEKDSDYMVLADDLIRIIESSILTFNVFLKMDKKKKNNGHLNSTTPLQLVQSSIEKVMSLDTMCMHASLVSESLLKNTCRRG